MQARRISMENVEQRVFEFIRENFYVESGVDLTRDTSLFEHGILDSTGLLEVVAFLEQELGVRALDEEFLPENFDTIGGICRFVERKRARGKSPLCGDMA